MSGNSETKRLRSAGWNLVRDDQAGSVDGRIHAVIYGWWRRDFLAAELAVAVSATLALVYLVHYSGFAACVDSVVAVSHPFVYGTLASICGSLLGFNLTATSIVLAAVNSNSPGLRIVRESEHYGTIRRVFGATARALGLATVLALAGLVIDRTGALGVPLGWSIVFFFLLSCLRVFRAAWVLGNVIALTARPASPRAQDSAGQ